MNQQHRTIPLSVEKYCRERGLINPRLSAAPHLGIYRWLADKQGNGLLEVQIIPSAPDQRPVLASEAISHIEAHNLRQKFPPEATE
jgi:hypothetical protein